MPSPEDYADLWELERPRSRKRVPMSRQQRAAQFLPFAALTGFEELIAKSGRVTSPRPVLAEDEKAQLDQTLQELVVQLPNQPRVRVRFFVPDPELPGGQIQEVSGRLTGIKQVPRQLVLDRDLIIDMAEIVALRAEN